MWKLSRMKGSVGLLSIAMRTIDFEAIFFINFVQFWINFHSFTWHWLDPYIVWSTRNPFSSFRINNCFCQIPLQSVFKVLFKLISGDFTLFNKFVFRTRGSLLLSQLLASSRIRHGGSPLSASHRKCILLSETECHIKNNLLTELAWAVLGNIGPRSWRAKRGPYCHDRGPIFPSTAQASSVSKRLLFWLRRGLNRLTCATRQIRGDSKLRD